MRTIHRTVAALAMTLAACVAEPPAPETSDTSQATIGGPFCTMTGCLSDFICQIACDNNAAQCLIYSGTDGIEHGRCLDWQPL